MRLPRDLGEDELADFLRDYGYEVTRQTGSHMRLATQKAGEHHNTIPRHKPLRVGTLNAVQRDGADHMGLERAELIRLLIDWK